MSLGARATKGGAKVAKEGKQQDKAKANDKQPAKEKVKPQATTEQLRMAHMIDRKSEDASDVRRMVLELMEMTCRTEEEVCSALHDSDNDMVAACNLLLEESQRIQGEWQTNEKKKKKPPSSAGNGEIEPPAAPRSRSGPRPPRRGEGEGAGRGRGLGRGRGGGRGGARGGRGGRRPGPSRSRHDAQADQWPPSNDNDFFPGTNNADSFPPTEDWDNEEWSGSLSDTKVFTPSASAQNAAGDSDSGQPQGNNSTEDWDAVPETNNGHVDAAHIPTYTYHNTNHTHGQHNLLEQIGQPASAGQPAPAAAKTDASQPQPPTVSLETYVSAHQHQVLLPMGMSGSLSAAQSQYLSQLTQQSQRHDNSVYTSNYGVYGSADISSQRKTQRARVPPPSKIPSTAVEMPGGSEASGATFLDVQFGALEPDALADPAPPPQTLAQNKQVPTQNEIQTVQAHEPIIDANSYQNSASLLGDSLSVVDTTPSNQSMSSDNSTSNAISLEKQLTASMKQLNVGVADVPAAVSGGAAMGVASSAPPAAAAHAQQPQYAQPHHRPKTVGQQSVYGTHHAVSHHPPVYGANVYAPQVNSTNASLTGASAMTGTAYPPSVTLPQYHTASINSYQTSSSASVYGGSALYTAAPYTAYQPTHQTKMPTKDTSQYDSSVASSNSLSNSSTTQTSTPKIATTTVSSAGSASAAYAVQSQPQPATATFYTPQQAAGQYAAYDEAQMMRGTLPHHMGTYYEVGYGVGAGREGAFGLGSGERFGRTDAASPQQVAAALPPGYAYAFYTPPPPTTYQYGVYPAAYGGGGSSVTGVTGVSANASQKVSTYAAQQQPQYDAHDTYKAASGPYTASSNKSGGGATAAADLTNTMYAKAHVALNKVNSYDKAAFPGTPPPFGAASHHQMYIQAPPQHHHPHHHQPQHQVDVRMNSSHNRRADSGAGGGRGAGAAKPTANKSNYSQSYWAPSN